MKRYSLISISMFLKKTKVTLLKCICFYFDTSIDFLEQDKEKV